MPVLSSASNRCRCGKAIPRRRSPRAFWRSSTGSIRKPCVWSPKAGQSSQRRISNKKPPVWGRGLREAGPTGFGSRNFQIFRRGSAAVSNKFVLDRLALVERAQASALDGRDVNKHILVAARGLDEPVALGRIEPLDGALLHRLSPKSFQMSAKTRSQTLHIACISTVRATSRILGKSPKRGSPRRSCRQGSTGRKAKIRLRA